MERFKPLDRIVTYDVFSTKFNGWMTLMTNFTHAPDYELRPSFIDKSSCLRLCCVQLPIDIQERMTQCRAPILSKFQRVRRLAVTRKNRRREVSAMRSNASPFIALSAECPVGDVLCLFAEQDRGEGAEDLAGISERIGQGSGTGFDHNLNDLFMIGDPIDLLRRC